MTTTATHNGTCQACGRTHAVNPKTGLLAKHGYTVDWGFFNGTCSGSDYQPLQRDTAHNVAIVKELNQRATALDIEAEGEITEVPVEVTTDQFDARGRRERKIIFVGREEYAGRRDCYGRFDDQVELLRRRLRRQAEHFRAHAADLTTLRERTFGTELIARAVEAPIKRESFGTYRDAHNRIEELKAQGITARQRREQWSRKYIVTYR